MTGIENSKTPPNWDDIRRTVRLVERGPVRWLLATCPVCGQEISREVGPTAGVGFGELDPEREYRFKLICVSGCGATGFVKLKLAPKL